MIAAMDEVEQEKIQEVINVTQGKGPGPEMTNFIELKKCNEVRFKCNLGMKMFKNPWRSKKRPRISFKIEKIEN